MRAVALPTSNGRPLGKYESKQVTDVGAWQSYCLFRRPAMNPAPSTNE
jgi:hypothetical protein